MADTIQNEGVVEQEALEHTESVVSEPDAQIDQTDTISDEISEVVKSERGQKRVQELANDAKAKKELEREVASLREQLMTEPPKDPVSEFQSAMLNQNHGLTGDYATDIQIASQQASSRAKQEVMQEVKRQQQLLTDAMVLEESYPELRKGSDNFDENLADSVTRLYKQASKSNPDVRLKDFVGEIMKIKKTSVDSSSAKIAETIARQVSDSAVVPTTTAPKRQERDLKDLSLEELEALASSQE